MDLSGKKIGIWGYGIVGKSIVDYLLKKNNILSVLDKKTFNQLEKEYFELNNIQYFDQNLQIDIFLQNNDFIIPSPGVDLRKFANYQNKFLCELDLFYLNFKKPIIAITGTIGKTTITNFLAQLLQKNGKNFIAAGNIGLAMCDLIKMQDKIDGVVLEVSSFQLEYSKFFAPSLAIITNFMPNHLDRHDSVNDYFNAKAKIFLNQNNNDVTLLPFCLLDRALAKLFGNTARGEPVEPYEHNFELAPFVNYFCLQKPKELQNIKFKNIFFIENNYLTKIDNNFVQTKLLNIKNLPDLSYLDNWLIICAALYLQNVNLNFDQIKLEVPEHRFEKFATINNVEFYNDSKSTVPNSTLAAVSKLQGKSIILFLGGISKGIDKSNMISQLKEKVKTVISFGSEANELKRLCEQNNILAYNFEFLEDSVSHCFKIMKANDTVLFSPSGASYDLFENYIHRGNTFKNLVQSFAKNI